jgi:hypothetical protein
VLRCDGCGCRSFFAKGWRAYLADAEGEAHPLTLVYCPPCADQEHVAEDERGYR